MTEVVYLYTTAIGISFNNEFSSFIKVYGDFNASLKPIHNFDGGFTYLLSNNLQVDISGGKGISGVDSFWFLSTGFSFRLPE